MRQTEFHRPRRVVDNLHLFDFLEHLDAALHLPRFRGFVAKPLDEPLGLLDLALLILILRFELFLPRRFFFDVIFEITDERMKLAPADFEDALGDALHENLVVRGQHDRAGIIEQKIFQPHDGFEIEVIGRFVQQQNLRLGEQKLGEGDTHHPATGKLVQGPRELRGAKADAAKDRLGLMLDRVAALRFEALAQFAVTFEQIRMRRVGHLPLHCRQILFELLQLREPGQRFGENAAIRIVPHFLFEITEPRALSDDDAAAIRLFGTDKHAKQRGFSRTVGAD
ncbi:MAG: hypothetical protein ALAOOOJD_04538 [bacterium]|nr:hypothetical protein [bacterium]